MKPLIFKDDLLWFCICNDSLSGIGYTPIGAYSDWVRRNNRVLAVMRFSEVTT